MKLNNKLIKSLSLGIVSLGLLAGIGMISNNSNNVHADDDLEYDMNQGLQQVEQSNKNIYAVSRNAYVQHVWGLRNDRFYYKDIVSLLDAYPEVAHTQQMNKIINYLSPKGRENFNEYYFDCSSTDEGGNLKESSDAAAGLDYDPHNSADNYLPLAHQHYISTAKEKKLQNPVTSLFSNDSTKPKHHHAKKTRTNRKHNKKARANKKLHKAHKYTHKAKKSTRRAKLSKKQFNKLNKQLKADKKALRSRRAKHNTKYRKALTRTIRKINRQLKLSRK